ncbi:TPA: hypothetical protein ACJK7E_000554 [Acinetobacter baumannii]
MDKFEEFYKQHCLDHFGYDPDLNLIFEKHEDGSYIQIEVENAKKVFKHQQAKVEEQAQEIANLKSLIQGHELRHQQNLSIKQKLTRRSEELQKRVDKAIRLLVEAELYQSEPNIDLAVKALKGEGQ